LQKQLFRKVSLERLSSPEQLDQLMTISSPRGWIGLVGVFCLLAVLVLWSFFGLIIAKIDANGVIIKGNDGSAQNLQAVLYLPFDQGQQVAPGMQVQLSPAQSKREEPGFVLGQVASVSSYPVTEEEMFSSLGNKGLLKLFSEQGAVVEVRVDLIPDEKSPLAYRGSPGVGTEGLIRAGELCTASIITSQQKPIALFLPMRL